MPEFPPNIYGSLSCLFGVQTYQLPRWLCWTSLECPQFWILALEGRPEQSIPGFLPWWHGVDNRGMVSQNVTNTLRKNSLRRSFQVYLCRDAGHTYLVRSLKSSKLIQIQPSNASDWPKNIYVPTSPWNTSQQGDIAMGSPLRRQVIFCLKKVFDQYWITTTFLLS